MSLGGAQQINSISRAERNKKHRSNKRRKKKNKHRTRVYLYSSSRVACLLEHTCTSCLSRNLSRIELSPPDVRSVHFNLKSVCRDLLVLMGKWMRASLLTAHPRCVCMLRTAICGLAPALRLSALSNANLFPLFSPVEVGEPDTSPPSRPLETPRPEPLPAATCAICVPCFMVPTDTLFHSYGQALLA